MGLSTKIKYLRARSRGVAGSRGWEGGRGVHRCGGRKERNINIQAQVCSQSLARIVCDNCNVVTPISLLAVCSLIPDLRSESKFYDSSSPHACVFPRFSRYFLAHLPYLARYLGHYISTVRTTLQPQAQDPS